MRNSKTGGIAIAVGIAMLLFSLLWSQDLGINRGYSEQDAIEYAEASELYHNAMHAEAGHDHEDHASEHPHDDLASAKERFDQALAKRDAALSSRSTISAIAKWTGIALILAGIVFSRFSMAGQE